MNKFFESNTSKYGHMNELLVSTTDVYSNDELELYDNNFEYLKDSVIPIPTKEIPPTENIIHEELQDIFIPEELRDEEQTDHKLMESVEHNEAPQYRYATRTSTRGSGLYWDPYTHQLIGSSGQSLVTSLIQRNIFNISVKTNIYVWSHVCFALHARTRSACVC